MSVVFSIHSHVVQESGVGRLDVLDSNERDTRMESFPPYTLYPFVSISEILMQQSSYYLFLRMLSPSTLILTQSILNLSNFFHPNPHSSFPFRNYNPSYSPHLTSPHPQPSTISISLSLSSQNRNQNQNLNRNRNPAAISLHSSTLQ